MADDDWIWWGEALGLISAAIAAADPEWFHPDDVMRRACDLVGSDAVTGRAVAPFTGQVFQLPWRLLDSLYDNHLLPPDRAIDYWDFGESWTPIRVDGAISFRRDPFGSPWPVGAKAEDLPPVAENAKVGDGVPGGLWATNGLPAEGGEIAPFYIVQVGRGAVTEFAKGPELRRSSRDLKDRGGRTPIATRAFVHWFTAPRWRSAELPTRDEVLTEWKQRTETERRVRVGGEDVLVKKFPVRSAWMTLQREHAWHARHNDLDGARSVLGRLASAGDHKAAAFLRTLDRG